MKKTVTKVGNLVKPCPIFYQFEDCNINCKIGMITEKTKHGQYIKYRIFIGNRTYYIFEDNEVIEFELV